MLRRSPAPVLGLVATGAELDEGYSSYAVDEYYAQTRPAAGSAARRPGSRAGGARGPQRIGRLRTLDASARRLDTRLAAHRGYLRSPRVVVALACPHGDELKATPPGSAEPPTPPGRRRSSRSARVPADYVERNRVAWERWALNYTATAARPGPRRSSAGESGGSRVGARSAVARFREGSDVIELGCGTASISAVGSRAQACAPSPSTSPGRSSNVATRLQEELGLSFPLIHANAEDVPYDTRELRPRDLRVRREPVVRAAPLAAEANRLLRSEGKPHLRHQQPAPDGLHAGGRAQRAGDRLAPRPLREPVREYPTTASSSSTSRTETGSSS